MTRDDALGPLVTAAGSRNEPFHRWLVFKQAYSPALVRWFLGEAMRVANLSSPSVPRRGHRSGPDAAAARAALPAPLLDPYSGTGTFVTECARHDLAAIGCDTVTSLAYVSAAKAAQQFTDPPDHADCLTWTEAAERFTDPVHRAALLCAVAHMHTAEGKLRVPVKPLCTVLAEVFNVFREDLARPLPRFNPILPGDAGRLDFIGDDSISGILASPPYLSRHDYARLTSPFETVYRSWYPATAFGPLPMPAHPRARVSAPTPPASPAVEEICRTLTLIQQPKLARIVAGYFDRLFLAVRDFARLLRTDAPCWIVLGGARLHDVYIPSDTILAEFAESVGLRVIDVRVARRVVTAGRRFGRLQNVAPRESIIMAKKC